jgi:protein TonB
MKNKKNYPGSFDDIIFENRNKEYGAYDLRKNYAKRGNVALSVSLFVVFVLVGLPLLSSYMKQNSYLRSIENDYSFEMSDINDRIDVPPVPPAPPAPIDLKQIKFNRPEIVDSLTDKNQMMDINETLFENAGKQSVDTTTRQDIVDVNVTDDLDDDKNYIPIDIEEQPSFLGGDAALFRYIVENVDYPEDARVNGIEGTVYVRFVVTKTGNIGETQIYKPADPILNEAALEVVKSLPKWSPGKKNGNPVNVWFIVPIKFKLN